MRQLFRRIQSLPKDEKGLLIAQLAALVDVLVRYTEGDATGAPGAEESDGAQDNPVGVGTAAGEHEG